MNKSEENTHIQNKIRDITIWGMVVNIILALLKTIAGFVVHSVALVADGIHSLTDLATDVAVLISSKAARRPPDQNHPYGHGKIETVGAHIIGLVLLTVGAGIGWSAINSLQKLETSYPGPLVVIFAVVSMIAKEILFHLTRSVARETHSSSLYANAWHHRSDALSSLAVLLGGVSSLLGFGYGDQIAGLLVSIMIMAVGGGIIFDNLKELSEHSIDKEMISAIESVLKENKDICHWHKLRTRKIGSEILVDVHIHVHPELTVRESHALTWDIENAIAKSFSLPVATLIHVEPCKDEDLEQSTT